MSEDGIMISMGEDGVWRAKEEPYMVLELDTEEDYNRLYELLELGREYEEIKGGK